MKRLIENLHGERHSYILPLFWQHGESEDVIRNEISKINEAGIYEFCVESRPFEDFCGEKWWKNMDVVIDECKRRGMRVWIFDDKHFPTGYANGALDGKRPGLRKRHLIEKNSDVIGPQKDAAVILPELRDEFYEELVAVTAMKRSGNGVNLTGEVIDLTDCVQDGMVYFDVPDGIWRVFTFIKTTDGVTGRSAAMIDPLNVESCELMISEVYEPHYEHYADEFGKTIAGFFSDEPGFRNLPKGYNTAVGVSGAALPWNDCLIEEISDEVGLYAENVLAALWYDCGEITRHIRCAYMDAVSGMYSENFCSLLGDWCREHNVEYIGHVLEDMNVSGRLGDGAGYYFRALAGQDMAGIDVVYHQYLPGFGDMCHSVFASTKNNDPEFYDFTLGKLGASMAHIQPNKKGRALCEIFGGYGWAEGLPMMKRMIDHFLAAGINRFVPHSFSPKENDPDCPPHFYGGGKNPQYKYMKNLMDYTGRMCHLLDGGTAKPSAAVLYHAEAEWCGGEYMCEQKPLKALLEAQLDSDIVPFDALFGAYVEDGGVHIGNTVYPCLVVPYAEVLPENCLYILDFLYDEGADIVFVDKVPENYTSGVLHAVPLDKISEYVSRCRDIGITPSFKDIRVYHYHRDSAELYVLCNESITREFRGMVEFLSNKNNKNKSCGVYDAYRNVLYGAELSGNRLEISIEPYESLVIVFGDIPSDYIKEEYTIPDLKFETLDLKYRIEVADAGENNKKDFRTVCTSGELFNINSCDAMPRFCGDIRYTAELKSSGGDAVIDLGEVGEVAELTVNGENMGVRICPPYRFDVSLNAGINELCINVANNPAYRERDRYSRFIMLRPGGLCGPVRLAMK